jgi:hypothetical protein
MNEIEAMVILKEIHSANQSIMLSSDNENLQNYKLLDCKALTIAIQALEKQIPKKPDKEDKKDMRCPICGTWSSKIFENQYCCYCGQRIKGSVEE